MSTVLPPDALLLGQSNAWHARTLRWVLPVLLVVVFAALSILTETPLYLTFLAAVLFTGWLVGPRQAALAGVLGAALMLSVLMPRYGAVISWRGFGLYAVLSALCVWTSAQFYAQFAQLRVAQTAQTDSEQRFRQLAESTHDAVFLYEVGDDGRFKMLYTNPAYTVMYGLRAEDYAKNPDAFLDLLQPDDRATVLAANQAVMRDGTPQTHTFRMVCPDTTRWIRARLFPVDGAPGTPRRLLGVEEDVTDTLLAEQREREREHEMHATLQTAQVGTWRLDVQTNTLHSSASLNTLFGLPSEGGLSNLLAAFMHPDDQPRVLAELEKTKRGEGHFVARHRAIFPQRGERWLISRGELVTHVDGSQHIIGAAVDVTDTVLAEQTLHERSQELDVALRAGRIGTWRLDLSSNMLYSGEAFQALTDLPAELPVDDLIRRLIHPDDVAAAAAALEHTLRTGVVNDPLVEYRALIPSLGVRWHLSQGQFITRADGSRHLIGAVVDVTDLKKTEAALRERESELSVALQTGRAGTWRVDTATSVATFDGTLDAQLGLPHQDDAAALMSHFVHPDDLPRIEASVTAALRREAPFDVEVRLVSPTQGVRWVASYGELISLWDGTQQLVGAWLDITDRKNAEAALRESEQRLRAMIDQAATGILFLGLDGRILEGNQYLSNVLGVPLSELVAQTLPMLASEPPHQAALQDALDQMASGALHHWSGEVCCAGPQDTVWLAVTLSMVYTNGGQSAYLAAIVQDTTARRRAEDALRVANARMEAALDQSHVVVFTQDADLRYTWVYNDNDGIVGKSDHQVVRVPAEADVMVALKRRVLHTGEAARQVMTLTRGPDAEDVRAYDILIQPLRAADGTVSGVVGAAVDITERLALEADARNSATLTEALAQERRLNTQKDQFMQMVSHEFRTPMSIILSSAQLLRDYADRLSVDKRVVRLNRIVEQVTMLRTMIEHAEINMSAQRGRLPLERSDVDLGALVQAAVAEQQRGSGAQHAWHVDVANAPTISADGALLQHVLDNLLSNAVKFSDEGGTVTVLADVADGQARLIVEDGGIGIPPEDFSKLFQAFQRGANVGTRAGLGLGLKVMYDVVAAHGGAIGVTSRAGYTSITVWLPLKA